MTKKTKEPTDVREPHPGRPAAIFPALEEDVLQLWKREKIFQKTLTRTKHGERFVFFEGPPTANGKPGIHHVLARAYKDVIVRYKTMRGYYVERKAGWDTHGLPVELQVEKALNISGKQQIENLVPGDKRASIEAFNAACKTSVMEFRKDWEDLTTRIGFWLDLKHPYITYDSNYVESVWWTFKQIWDAGFVYKGHKVVPHCPRCETALSSHEVAQGYKNVVDTSVYVKFKVTQTSVPTLQNLVSKGEEVFVLSWTTTPWTLPGNVALAVGKDIAYQLVKHDGAYLLIARERAAVLGDDVKVMEDFTGEQLIGTAYEPLYPGAVEKGSSQTAWTILPADFVTTTDGTGVVHTAVMYGEDDYALGEAAGLPKVHTVDPTGKFLPSVTRWVGKFVKDSAVESEIITDLKERGLLHKVEQYSHDYPFCWRCSTPLLYYAKDSWFIRVSAVRSKLIENNRTINWVPAYLKDGRFGEWLKDAKDWAISRERYWGTPLPIWECDACHAHQAVGSFAELKVKEGFDPHRPFIDDVTLTCATCQGTMHRVPEVLDVWFDSGAMPFAQWHYPFEDASRVDEHTNFPADYISEAIDQTRGWFYTLLAISTLLGKGAPYKNVISLGHILDAKGQKMSKSKGNVVVPAEVINTYGADALRLHLFTMSQAGDPKNFDVQGVDEVVKKTLLIFWNVVTFYQTHVGSQVTSFPEQPAHVMDQWILARLAQVTQGVQDKLDGYDPTSAARALQEFITDLSTWYVRRSRDRMRSGKHASTEAVAVLRHVIRTTATLLAPFAPFISEQVYQLLRHTVDPESVHLAPWPAITHANAAVLADMQRVRDAVELGHAIRKEQNLKVRQPLASVFVNHDVPHDLQVVLREELNVEACTIGKAMPAGWVGKSRGSFQVALNTTLDEELRHKGLVRELARHVNDMRKAAGLTVKDLVDVEWMTDDPTLQHAFTEHAAELRDLTHARSIAVGTVSQVAQKKELILGGRHVTFGIST